MMENSFPAPWSKPDIQRKIFTAGSFDELKISMSIKRISYDG